MAFSRFTLAIVLVCLSFSTAFAAPSKLDPLARKAVASLRSGAAIEAVRANGSAVTDAREIDVFIRGDVSRAQLEAAGARVRTELPGLFTAFLPLAAVDRVAALPGVQSIRGAAPVELELDASVPTTGANLLRMAGPTFTGLNGAGVLIGDVDTGVDYGHGDFDDAAGNTRLVRIWDQTVAGAPPSGYAYGTEWTNAQIDANTSTETDLGGHGTHVLGIAGGDGSQTGGAIPAFTYTGMAPRADLVMVKSDFTTTHILDGVSYIFGLATTRAENAVVNLSLGSHFGPHDGTSDFEAGLSAMTGPGRIIIKSAGNERGSARHAEVLAAGAGTNVTLTVAGSATGAVFAIDGYYESTENMSVRIRTPNGTMIGPIVRGAVNAAYPGTSTANGTVYVENGAFTTATGDFEVYVEVNVGAAQNMNGTWTFTFIPVALGAANGEVDLWRFFVSPTTATASFVTGSTNEELISEPGNAVDLITVGAWVTKGPWTACNGTASTFGGPAVGNLATFSSPGPTRDGRRKPDIAAPGIAIGSTNSFDFANPCAAPGTPYTLLNDASNHVINAGTSMAAPHVSGAVALLMQKYGAIRPAFVRHELEIHAKVDAFTGAVWNQDWGNGKLYLGTALDPVVGVLDPDGGEVAGIGGGAIIQWSAAPPAVAARAASPEAVTSVDLRLSRDAGLTWESIAAGVPNTGTFNWTVTGPVTTRALVSVVAHDDGGRVGGDISAATFTIAASPTSVDVGPSEVFGLGEVTPNPTPNSAQVAFGVGRSARIRVAVLDVQGRNVATLADGTYRPGRYFATWNGQIGNRPAPAGLYFIRYLTPGHSFVRRVALAR